MGEGGGSAIAAAGSSFEFVIQIVQSNFFKQNNFDFFGIWEMSIYQSFFNTVMCKVLEGVLVYLTEYFFSESMMYKCVWTVA